MPGDLRSVAVYAPMKRGLKVESTTPVGNAEPVAVYAPMKRGLKVEAGMSIKPPNPQYSAGTCAILLS